MTCYYSRIPEEVYPVREDPVRDTVRVRVSILGVRVSILFCIAVLTIL